MSKLTKDLKERIIVSLADEQTGKEMISILESAGAGDISSVNGQTGTVELNAEDIPYNNADSGLTATNT